MSAPRPVSVTETARAKINLALAVGELRPDGYHGLQTVMQTISLADEVSVTPLADDRAIRCRCAWANGDGTWTDDPGLSGTDNIAVTAARCYEDELRRAAGRNLAFGLNIQIKKNIPAQAGLGGGSADAAAVLRALNRLEGMPLSQAALEAAARRCGADVPFCLRGGTQWAEGAGTTLMPLPAAPALPVIIVQPSAGVSTAEAYRLFDRLGEPEELDRAEWRSRLASGGTAEIASGLRNNFEPVVAAVLPVIAEIKAMLLREGCSGALLTGSGSAVFGLSPTAGGSLARRVEAEFACRAWLAVFE